MAMTTARKRAAAVAGAFVGLAAAIGVMVVPSSAEVPSAVRLHMASDGRYFAYGNTTQELLPAKNGCQITSAEPVINLDAPTPNTANPVLGADGIGVKQSNSSGNGSPCSQVAGPETLKLSGGTALDGRLFTGVRLDLEMTGNAVVTLTFIPPAGGSTGGKTTTYTLQTGSAIDPLQTQEPGYDSDPNDLPYDASSTPTDSVDACAAPNSSGPNSGGSDNCRWLVQPEFPFASVTIASTNGTGTVSLEGGGDFGGGAAFETLLYLSNSAPTAVADTASTSEDSAGVSINVVGNDTDPEGDPLTPALVAGPANGTVSLNSTTKQFTYVPALNHNGTDSFTYRVSDGLLTSNTVTVTISISAVNDPPVPKTAGATTNEDTAVVVQVATDVDDTDGDATCTLTDSVSEEELDGDVENAAGFNVTVTPPDDFFGTMLLSCTITDGEASVQMVTPIQVGVAGVNDAPVAVDDSDDVDEGGSVDINVVANDEDIDSATLFVAPGSITIAPGDGTATINASGGITYTPPANFIGTKSFTYRVKDAALTSANTATVSVGIFPVICSGEPVSDEDGEGADLVSGFFKRLTDSEDCKRYTIDAVASDETVTFKPSGSAKVAYRGVLIFPADEPPVGQYPLLLQYDPSGGTNFKPVQWCIAPMFDADGFVESATLPGDQTAPEEGQPDLRERWCVAKAETVPNGDGNLVTEWQVYGVDDPRFTR